MSEESTAIAPQSVGWMEQLNEFDWKRVPPHQMAMVLTKKPYKGKDGRYFLTPAQALVFAMRCFELGLSPISSEVWFNADTWTVEPTVEGQKKLCTLRGLDVAPPTFTDETRPWPRWATPHPNLKDDVGKKCTIEVWMHEAWKPLTYTAWVSEWFRPTPMWRQQPEHMLQVRAYGKTLEMVSGVGISGMPSATDEDVAGAAATR